MGVFSKISGGLAKSRNKFKESMWALIGRGPDLDEEFWDELEETLVLSDVGGAAAMDIVENLRSKAMRQNLPDAYAVLDLLSEEMQDTFAEGADELFGPESQVVLFVGINGTGKTTTVGKIAKAASDAGRSVILGSADTFRAAAIEQLEEWARRADVPIVTRERGSDPASVCYETIDEAEAKGADLALIDTAGRLHTSDDLMRELVKVASVTRKRADAVGMKVFTVLVIDATTGQNGMQQAREFDRALDLDALIVTKLDGTAKGGIALAISHELGLPIVKIGVGEGIDDVREFDPEDFVRALIGDFEEDEAAEGGAAAAGEREGDAPVADEADVDAAASTVPGEALVPAAAPAPPRPLASPVPAVAPEAPADTAEGAADAAAVEEADTTEPAKMSWAEFVEYDDARRAAEPKKHFWEKW